MLSLLRDAVRLIRALDDYPKDREALIKSVHDLKILARKYQDDELEHCVEFRNAIDDFEYHLAYYRELANHKNAVRIGMSVFEQTDTYQSLQLLLTPEELENFRQELLQQFSVGGQNND